MESPFTINKWVCTASEMKPASALLVLYFALRSFQAETRTNPALLNALFWTGISLIETLKARESAKGKRRTKRVLLDRFLLAI